MQNHVVYVDVDVDDNERWDDGDVSAITAELLGTTMG